VNSTVLEPDERKGKQKNYRPLSPEDDRQNSSHMEATEYRDSGIFETDARPQDWPYGDPIVMSTFRKDRKSHLGEYGQDIPTATRYENESVNEPYDAEEGDTERIPSPRVARASRSGASRSMAFESKPQERTKHMIPEGSKKKIMKRISRLLREISENEEYQEAIEYLLTASQALLQHEQEYRQHPIDANVFAAALELKRLLESFANQSLTPLINASIHFIHLIRSDPQLAYYIHEMRSLLVQAIRDPSFLETSEFHDQLSLHLDRGRSWIKAPEAHQVVVESDKFIAALRKDPITSALIRDIGRLTETMLMEESGRMTFKADLINDFRVAFLPSIVSQIKFIALPRIEHRDATMDLILDNLVLTLENALPNVFVVEMVNRAVLSPRNEIEDQFSHFFHLTAYVIDSNCPL
jgi:hypothetical protein